MSLPVKIALGIGIAVLLLGVLAGGLRGFYELYWNDRIARELTQQPDSERSRKVMLITLPSGRSIPVNYLREGDRVYAGADGRWWKELVGDGFAVEVLIRGERLSGTGRAVLDDPGYTKDVFSRLRPKAIPGFGTLIEIRLAASS